MQTAAAAMLTLSQQVMSPMLAVSANIALVVVHYAQHGHATGSHRRITSVCLYLATYDERQY